MGAEVRAADPHVAARYVDERVARVELTAEELAAADAVVLLTDHDAFDWKLVREHAAFVFDTRHRLAGEHIEYL